MMRITGGDARGRLIKAPPGRQVRPTSDRVRQAVFNILFDQIIERPVIDLFAGAGTMGLEALSRGAKFATFVEIDRRVARILAENIAQLGFQERSLIVRQDVFVSAPNITGRAWDGLIFADPPYGRGYALRTVRLVAPLLAPGGCLIVEHHTNDDVEANSLPDTIQCTDRRRYGDTIISFLRRGQEEEIR